MQRYINGSVKTVKQSLTNVYRAIENGWAFLHLFERLWFVNAFDFTVISLLGKSLMFGQIETVLKYHLPYVLED